MRNRVMAKKALRGILSILRWIFRYSGLEFIYRKFNPSENGRPLPTGVLWIIGIYIAFFGIVSQRYENRIDVIENRTSALMALLANKETRKNAIRDVPRVQMMESPQKPNVLNPLATLQSLFSRSQGHPESINTLKRIIEDLKSDLSGVYLSRANLEGVNLEGANLNGANLERANLRDAVLDGADLEGANLRHADLEGADIAGAKLRGSNLILAILKQAEFIEADLQNADLGRADLRNAFLQEANLKGAYLGDANLLGANLEQANFQEARFQESKHWLGNLNKGGVKGAKVTIDQLSKVKTLYKAKLTPELLAQIKKQHPHLLDKPKEE
jgi:uncharacterized protein YjbI with pentapeptide repeats